MRGKGTLGSDVDHADRITPAYAGKRRNGIHLTMSCWDHPRLCGEKLPYAVCPLLALGSPPPMRGKGIPVPLQTSRFGITPAYAGKREMLHVLLKPCQDHPRLCGEKHKCHFSR